MSNSLDMPKPFTGILPLGDNYHQKRLSEDLEEQDTLLPENSPSEPVGPKGRRCISNTNLVAFAILSLSIVIGSLVWLSVSASPQADKTPKSSTSYTDCGSNYSTAAAAGCIYDIIAPQWMPPECYNAKLSNEHASKVSKPMFFRWPNLTEPLSDDPMELSLHDTVWTFDEYHTTHCVYILELAAAREVMGSLSTKPSRRDFTKAYAPISNSEPKITADFRSTEKRRRRQTIVILSSFVAVLILLVPFSYFLLRKSAGTGAFNNTSLTVQHDNIGSFIVCPENPSSARESGCSFDLLANGWIPAPCFDATMHHDFVDGSDYGFFYDQKGEQRVHQDAIMERDNSRYPDGLWVTFEEHVSHCRYLVNGSIRAVSRPEKAFLDVYLDRDHMMHCYGVLGESRPLSHIETYVKAFFETRRCYIRD
ncbi:hypothetical protein BS50DRAFT_678674 [Corynespora cassiicola Philippines]|uniref:Uncharacterized protein n=1 Tax=Corynespora cassiicola Philippines TaxID=1448308 RepID=A0A2T2NGW3_CORCC|nr:hypothetical protein BS50DRAFT_678674 [Corynespora cassiicola Philippines]